MAIIQQLQSPNRSLKDSGGLRGWSGHLKYPGETAVNRFSVQTIEY